MTKNDEIIAEWREKVLTREDIPQYLPCSPDDNDLYSLWDNREQILELVRKVQEMPSPSLRLQNNAQVAALYGLEIKERYMLAAQLAQERRTRETASAAVPTNSAPLAPPAPVAAQTAPEDAGSLDPKNEAPKVIKVALPKPKVAATTVPIPKSVLDSVVQRQATAAKPVSREEHKRPPPVRVNLPAEARHSAARGIIQFGSFVDTSSAQSDAAGQHQSAVAKPSSKEEYRPPAATPSTSTADCLASDLQTNKFAPPADTSFMQGSAGPAQQPSSARGAFTSRPWSRLHMNQSEMEKADKEEAEKRSAIAKLPTGRVDAILAEKEAEEAELKRDGFLVKDTYDLTEKTLVQTRAPPEDTIKNMGVNTGAIGRMVWGDGLRKNARTLTRLEKIEKAGMAEERRRAGYYDEHGNSKSRRTQEEEELEDLAQSDDEWTLDRTHEEFVEASPSEDATSPVPTKEFGKLSFAAAAAAGPGPSPSSRPEDLAKAREAFFATKDTKSLKGLNRFALDSNKKWPTRRNRNKMTDKLTFEPELEPYLEKDAVTKDRFLNLDHALLTYHPRLESSPAEKKQWLYDHGLRYKCAACSDNFDNCNKDSECSECRRSTRTCRYVWASHYSLDCPLDGIDCSAVHGRAEHFFLHCEEVWGTYKDMAGRKSHNTPRCDDYEPVLEEED